MQVTGLVPLALKGSKGTQAGLVTGIPPPTFLVPIRVHPRRHCAQPALVGFPVLSRKLVRQRSKNSILRPLIPCNSSVMTSREL